MLSIKKYNDLTESNAKHIATHEAIETRVLVVRFLITSIDTSALHLK